MKAAIKALILFLVIFWNIPAHGGSPSTSAPEIKNSSAQRQRQPQAKPRKPPEPDDWVVSLAGTASFLSNIKGYDGEFEFRGRHFGFGFFANTINLTIPNTDLASSGVAYGLGVHYRPFPYWYVGKYNLLDFGLYSNLGLATMKTADGLELPAYGIGYAGLDLGYAPIPSMDYFMIYSKLDSQFLYHGGNVVYMGSAVSFGIKLSH
jgi:hypothetical protein